MRNTYAAFRYQLRYFRAFSAIWLLVVVLNIIFTTGVMLFIVESQGSDSQIVVGQIDAQSYVFALILGLLCFKTSFKFMLANGVSRKRFFWANLGALTAAMAVWTGVVLLLAAVFRLYAPYKMVHELLYRGADPAGGICWLFAGFLLLATLGWCISMLYYRSNLLKKILLSTLPTVFLALLVFIDSRIDWAIARALVRFFIAVMGLTPAAPNPYRSALSMLLLAALLCGGNYLLVRRAPIKE